MSRATLPSAAAASLALHGAALAAMLWLGGSAAAPEPLETRSFAVILAEAAPATESSIPAPPERPASALPAPIVEAAPAVVAAPEEPIPAAARMAPAPAPEFAAPPRRPQPPKPTPAPSTTAVPSRAAPSEAPAPAQLAARAPEPGGTPPLDGAFEPPRYGLAELANPHPPYPLVSRQRGEEGRVVIRVAVNAAGNPERAEIAQSSGHARLDRAALRTVGGWRFAPARMGARAVPGTVEVPVTFRIADD